MLEPRDPAAARAPRLRGRHRLRRELFRALRAGIDPQKIVFSGVGKRPEEIETALETGILAFNVESEGELEAISAVAARLGIDAPIALRVNPDVDAETHPYVSTGLKKNKLGISVEDARKVYARARALPRLIVRGIDCHIGSQLTKIGPSKDAIGRVAELARDLVADGTKLELLDVGGGLGIPDQEEDAPPSPEEYARALEEAIEPFAELDLTIVCEPGRVLVGNAAVLLTRVLYEKMTSLKHFTIVDAAMNDLGRPAFHGSHHGLRPVRRDPEAQAIVTDVVGPICESSDVLARDRELARVPPGELLAVMSAGAYAFTMSSSYDTRPRAAEVLVDGDRYAVIRRREELEDLIRGESIPAWLA